MHARTFGSNQQSRKNRSAKDSYGMTTFDIDDAEEGAVYVQGRNSGDKAMPGKNQIVLTREVDITTNSNTEANSNNSKSSKRTSRLWPVSERKSNESQEELTGKSPKDTYIEELVVPRSFLADEKSSQKF